MNQLPRPKVTTVFNTCIVEYEEGKCVSFPKYQHSQLQPGRTIRLLKVEAPTRPWCLSKLSEMHDYTLFEYELENSEIASIDVSNSPYVAMSYSWGEPVLDSPLMMMANGQRSVLPITASAWEAIQRTLPAIGRYGKLMWIDQICINQEDEQEKERQVTLMGDIYRRCFHCMIWLGSADNNTKAAFDLLGKLQETFVHTEAMPMEPRQVSDLSHAHIRAQLAIKLGRDVLPPSDDSGWCEIARLLQDRDWFTRLWTFQEAVLCYTGDASVRCGVYNSPVITFMRAAMLLGNVHVFAGLHFTNGRAALMQISEIRFHVEHNRPTPLARLLENNDLRRCRNPSDRIYALLGLRKEDGNAYPVDVKYEKAPQYLFRETIRKILKSQQSLRICADGPERECCSDALDLPSWVPDWTQRRLTSTFELYNPSATFFRASNGRAHVEVKGDPAILIAEGKIVDAVQSIIEVEIPDAVTQDIRRAVLVESVIPHLLDALSSESPGRSYAEIAYTIVSTLTVGGYTRKNNLMDDSGVQHEAWSTAYSSRMLTFVLSPSEGEEVQQLDVDPETWLRALTREVSYCVNRKFVLLKNNMLALVPKKTQTDDSIVILHGSSLPLVLRCAGNDEPWTLIGPCYVEGIMHGESVRWTSGDEFRIC